MLIQNSCSNGNDCPNISIIKELQHEIKQLKKTINDLMKMNEYFKLSINRKEERYKALTSNNSLNKDKSKEKRIYSPNKISSTHIKKEHHANKFAATTPILPIYNNCISRNRKEEYGSLRNSQQKINIFRSNKSSNVSSLNSTIHYQNDGSVSSLHKIVNRNNGNMNIYTVPSLFISTTSSNKSSFNRYKYSVSLSKKAVKHKNRHLSTLCPKDSIKTLNLFNDEMLTSNCNQNKKSQHHHNTINMGHTNKNHYDYLTNLSEKTTKQKPHNHTCVSFLSLTFPQLKEIEQNTNLTYLINLTTLDEQFISEIRSGNDEYLYSLCDFLHILFIDYQQSIHLISRIKMYLSSSIELVRSLLNNTSTNVLLKNICSILDCERASLYIYDSLSDMLIVHSAEGMKVNQIKVEKHKGIIGYVFKHKKRLRIDDAYQDPRFNKEIDIELHYKTKSILCFPLFDSQGDIFGVIEAINKKKKRFDQDDEELMKTLSKQASAILKNMINMDKNAMQISRLVMISDFLIRIININDKKKFSEYMEELIIRLFSSPNTQILFVNKDRFLHNYIKDITYKDKSLGLIHLVMKKKEAHGCPKVKNCKYHNTLVDIDTRENLLTFPIIFKDICIGVIQCTVNCDLGECSHLPGEHEMECFDLISRGFIEWYIKNVYNET